MSTELETLRRELAIASKERDEALSDLHNQNRVAADYKKAFENERSNNTDSLVQKLQLIKERDEAIKQSEIYRQETHRWSEGCRRLDNKCEKLESQFAELLKETDTLQWAVQSKDRQLSELLKHEEDFQALLKSRDNQIGELVNNAAGHRKNYDEALQKLHESDAAAATLRCAIEALQDPEGHIFHGNSENSCTGECQNAQYALLTNAGKATLAEQDVIKKRLKEAEWLLTNSGPGRVSDKDLENWFDRRDKFLEGVKQ